MTNLKMDQPRVLRSVMDGQDLAERLSTHYDCGEWTRCIYWLNGLNDTYSVHTAHERFVLRVYRTEVKESNVLYELSLLDQLKQILGNGRTKVAEAVAKHDGQMHTTISAPEGPRIAVLFRYAPGSENKLRDEQSCYSFGQSAADLHLAMDQVSIDRPRRQLDDVMLIDESLRSITQFVCDRRDATLFFAKFAESLKERVSRFEALGLDEGLCHGDLHGSNNASMDGNKFTHYDFEWAAPGWRAYDLAQVRLVRDKTNQGHPDRAEELWKAVLAGYRSVRTFSEMDEQAIPLFMLVRRFWVMNLDALIFSSTCGAIDLNDEWIDGFISEFKQRESQL